MDQKLKILMLSSRTPFDILIQRACRMEGFLVEIVAEDDFGFRGGTEKGPIEPPPGYAEALAKALAEHKFDAIVVQNNRGAGVAKTRLLPEELWAKTIVMWTFMPRGEEKAYTEEFGISRFAEVSPEVSRLCEKLKEFLPNNEAPVE